MRLDSVQRCARPVKPHKLIIGDSGTSRREVSACCISIPMSAAPGASLSRWDAAAHPDEDGDSFKYFIQLSDATSLLTEA